MRRLVVVFVVPFLLSSCGGGGSSTPTAPTATPSAPAPTLTGAQQTAVAARMTSEAVDSLAESLTATGILTVSLSHVERNSPMVVLINEFQDTAPPFSCRPSGQIRFQARYAGAVRTDDQSDHVEATGTMTYDNCVLDVEGGPITVNGTISILALLGRQPSGRETMRQSGSIRWTRADGVSGSCDANWTTVLALPDLRRFSGADGALCAGVSLTAGLQYVSTYLQQRRAAFTNMPPGLPQPGGPSNAAGQWTGTIEATNPCSVGSPVGRYNWTGTFTQNGNTFTFAWRDSYFAQQMIRTFPTNQTFTFTISDEFDFFTLTGRFSTDYRSLTGDVSGRIDCGTVVRSTTGSWQGRRTGP